MVNKRAVNVDMEKINKNCGDTPKAVLYCLQPQNQGECIHVLQTQSQHVWFPPALQNPPGSIPHVFGFPCIWQLVNSFDDLLIIGNEAVQDIMNGGLIAADLLCKLYLREFTMPHNQVCHIGKFHSLNPCLSAYASRSSSSFRVWLYTWMFDRSYFRSSGRCCHSSNTNRRYPFTTWRTWRASGCGLYSSKCLKFSHSQQGYSCACFS